MEIYKREMTAKSNNWQSLRYCDVTLFTFEGAAFLHFLQTYNKKMVSVESFT